MKKFFLCLMTTFVSVILATSVAHAALISGTSLFGVAGQWSATVTWQVFAPGDATSPLGALADYGYFYQIFNDPTSELSLTQFAIGNPYKVVLTSVGYINGTGNVSPSTYNGGTYGAVYSFDFPNQIAPNQTSDILYLTSAYPPGTASAGLQAPGYNNYQDVPFPVPEPTSMLLFGMGVLGLIGLGRKKA